MKSDFKNPFAGYGVIVSGDRFIGRRKDLRVIENKIVTNEPGNLAIVGQPKIGKSSLVFKSIMDRKHEIIAKGIIPIWINLGMYEQTPEFFYSMVKNCLEELEKLNLLSESIKYSAQIALKDIHSQSADFQNILKLFTKIREEDYHVLFILDEFDHARSLFKGNSSGFQKLRELSYRPEWKVTYITMSRRTIREIEAQSNTTISNLHNIFPEHYLTGFNDKDMNEYYNKFSPINLSISLEQKNKIDFYCGGHPYLLEVLGYEIVEIFRENFNVDINEAAYNTEQSLINHYDHLIDLLEEDGSLNKLLQILFGPVVDVDQTDVDRFLKLGIIKTDAHSNFVAFSDHFQIFLNLVRREADLWPIWSKTEKSLRRIIETTMTNHYGETWIAKLEDVHHTLKPIFNECREAQKKEEKSFGSRSSQYLIDFTYPQDLFAIIFAEWSIFRPIFGKDKNYWDQRKQLLAKIRNPLAHHRGDILHDYEKQIAEGFCNEILSIIK